MIPTYEQIKAVRGGCEDCGGSGLNKNTSCLACEKSTAVCFSKLCEDRQCPTCHGTTNGVLTFMVPIDVPDGYEFDKIIGVEHRRNARFKNNGVNRYERLPYKINEVMPVTCDGEETTVTVIDIKVVIDKSYITEKADKDNPYGKRVLENKWNFEVKVLEGL